MIWFPENKKLYFVHICITLHISFIAKLWTSHVSNQTICKPMKFITTEKISPQLNGWIWESNSQIRKNVLSYTVSLVSNCSKAHREIGPQNIPFLWHWGQKFCKNNAQQSHFCFLRASRFLLKRLRRLVKDLNESFCHSLLGKLTPGFFEAQRVSKIYVLVQGTRAIFFVDKPFVLCTLEVEVVRISLHKMKVAFKDINLTTQSLNSQTGSLEFLCSVYNS